MNFDTLRPILEEKKKRHDELESLLVSAELYTTNTPEQVTQIVIEQTSLAPLAKLYTELLDTELDIEETKEILGDPELEYDAKLELASLKEDAKEIIAQIIQIMVQEESGSNVVFIEIKAGVGGEEAALFAKDLSKIYIRYAEDQGWGVGLVSTTYSDCEGYKAVTLRITGKGVENKLKSEAGGHRVQRVPETDSKGRRQTSLVTVAVLPEIKDVDIEVKPADYKVETFRASGPGGQHRNKTDSAIRITHFATGITAIACAKSQHQNREVAMQVLKSRIHQKHKDERDSKRHAAKQKQLGSGDRSDKVRTYNWPQNRVTDHRLSKNYSLSGVLEGKLDSLLADLRAYRQEKQIQS